MQQGPAVTLASQIAANTSSIEKLWAMAYQRQGGSWRTPFPIPLEYPAGDVYTIVMDASFEIVLPNPINQGLTVHGELIPAQVGVTL